MECARRLSYGFVEYKENIKKQLVEATFNKVKFWAPVNSKLGDIILSCH